MRGIDGADDDVLRILDERAVGEGQDDWTAMHRRIAPWPGSKP